MVLDLVDAKRNADTMTRMGTGSKKRVRRSFTDEFTAGAVRLVLDEGKTISQGGRDLDDSQSVVGNWAQS